MYKKNYVQSFQIQNEYIFSSLYLSLTSTVNTCFRFMTGTRQNYKNICKDNNKNWLTLYKKRQICQF